MSSNTQKEVIKILGQMQQSIIEMQQIVLKFSVQTQQILETIVEEEK